MAQAERSDSDSDSDRGRRLSRRPPKGAASVARRAARQLAELTGRTPDAVSGIEPVDDGWRITVEMVELERIPPTTSVLGTYEATLDGSGDVLEFERVRRYHRNQADGA